MLVSRQQVTTFIPQRQPIVVVHGLVKHAETTSVSVFQVEANHLFVRDGKLLASGLMENIAQTAALRSGYHFAQQAKDKTEKKQPPIGFIGALKNFVFTSLPTVGSELKTTVTVAHEVMGMQVVEAQVHVDEKMVASCEMKIFLSQEE